MVTAAARPPVFWIGEDRERVRGWPIGAALLEALSDMNDGVRDALTDERARLAEHGYPADLPLPALWWNSSASVAEDAVAKSRLVALASAPG